MNAHDPIEVGKRLRLLREGLKMKQTALCRLTKITDQVWNNAETGDNLLTVPNAVKLCRVTGVTMDWIYRGQITALPSSVLTAITKPRQRD
jgi:transcriptional regulator with XRE-family HTH domain